MSAPSRRLVHAVTAAGFGDRLVLEGGRLTVPEARAQETVADPALASVRLSWVSPGESARIVKILDAVEPRTLGPGGGGVFPGFVAPAMATLTGDLHVLRGAAVVVAGHLPRAQEALVDMSGPAQPLSFLGRTHNLVVEFTPVEGASWQDVDAALRRGSLRLAALLAEAGLDAEPSAVEDVGAVSGGSGRYREGGAPDGGTAGQSHGGLPRVGVIANLQTQGVFKDVFHRGWSFATSEPIAVDPWELDIGAVVCGQFGHPGLRNCTHMHQNNPVVAALRRRHGYDLDFAGVILAPEPVRNAEKESVSTAAAALARELGWHAAVVTKEGAGNADADMALKMDALEDLGLTAVGIFAEMSGRDGDGPPVVVPPERATAMVSTGNYDERLALPAVERALGGERLEIAGAPATAAVEVATAAVLGSLSPLGWGRLTAS